MSYNPEYYVMKHLSHFIRQGAVRLGLLGELAASALAFRNPDGEIVLLAANQQGKQKELVLEGGITVELPARSVNTLAWAGSD